MPDMESELAMLLGDVSGVVETLLIEYDYATYWNAADVAFREVAWMAQESMCTAYDARYNAALARAFVSAVPPEEMRALLDTCYARMALGGAP